MNFMLPRDAIGIFIGIYYANKNWYTETWLTVPILTLIIYW